MALARAFRYHPTDALACFPAGQGIFTSGAWRRYTGCKRTKSPRSDRCNIRCMTEAIERVIVDLQRYSEAGQRLAEQLHQLARLNAEDVERLRAGVSMTEACQLTNSSDRSRGLTRIMAEFEESRRVIRASTVIGLLEEGRTTSEIGQVFGVSRQLANRLVKDARALYGDPAGAPMEQTEPF